MISLRIIHTLLDRHSPQVKREGGKLMVGFELVDARSNPVFFSPVNAIGYNP